MLTQAKYFSATTDMWTSCSAIPYMTFTVHSIDNEWSLQSFCLGSFPAFEDHTGQNLSEAVTNVLANWELTIEQIVAITTDNGSNIVSAFRCLDMLRLTCFGSNLDLAIKKSLQVDRVSCAIARCQSLVELFIAAGRRTETYIWNRKTGSLRPSQTQVDRISCYKVGSTYNMVSCIMEQQQAISAVLAEDRKNLVS